MYQLCVHVQTTASCLTKFIVCSLQGKNQDGTGDSSDSTDYTGSGTTEKKDDTVAPVDAEVITQEDSEKIKSGETKLDDPESEDKSETMSDVKPDSTETMTDSQSRSCGATSSIQS